MSFKRFDPEDIVLSSELITFPTWFVKGKGDFDEIEAKDLITSDQQGASKEYFTDYYNIADFVSTGSGEEPQAETGFDPTQSKCMFSVAYAKRPNADDTESTSSFVPTGSYTPEISEVIFGQYRSLVLGDEDSGFRFGRTRVGVNSENVPEADRFFAITVDRARFREKLEPVTCRLVFINTEDGNEPDPPVSMSTILSGKTEDNPGYLVLAPDVTGNEQYLDSGRVYDLARYVVDDSGSNYVYDDENDNRSYGYFLPDIGVILINADVEPFKSLIENMSAGKKETEVFFNSVKGFKLRSQETVTSNFVFARARNAEFNYSTNPSNITGSAGNLRWGTMINQPQAFITTVGLYNDSNELLAVAKLSKPLVKDFTKEALIRIKLDY